ncbi:putative actin binding protein [Heterostelium album PN500]|uniref:Coactosin n=1 Tax=Heterostelium pallidum (strain ATCC 26659 / Pp 5 / PN500) TaxID=670386 RepID=D3B339_HETP5|nr:putative actin binding protein [Heterostelium album PN500]EFA83737.1 putative actin binding protein [Heterostelium album PN500]|eukprot:XP_020435854.1 putative actin binding protein [Heterostelium album PN500]
MSLQYVDEQAIKSAIADLRSDKNDTDWVLLSFEDSKSKKVKLLATGNGGVASLSEQLADNIVGFALVRKIDVIDNSETVKYAFIQWIGDKVGILQKAFVSIATSHVKTLFTPFHVDFQISSLSEISDSIVQTKISETSGSGSRVLNESGTRNQTTASTSVRKSVAPGSLVNKDAVTLGNEQEVREALREFRSDDNETNWVLFGYDAPNSNTIVLLGKGTGGPSELIDNLRDDIVGYGLTRIVEKIDNSNTVKFAFINWTGENIHRMQRARLGTHSGFVKQLVQPYHVDISCADKSEITEEIVVTAITKNSGTKSSVLADQPTRTSPTTSSFRGAGSSGTTNASGSSYRGATPTSSGAPVTADDSVRAAIRDVRSDSTPTNWTLIGYQPNNTTLTVIASGNGDADELVAHLKPEIVAYGLVRVKTQFDLSEITQFVWINFVGESIPRMFRAKLGTHSGFVKETFSPFHVDIHASTPNEVSNDIVITRVTSNAGTLSKSFALLYMFVYKVSID